MLFNHFRTAVSAAGWRRESNCESVDKVLHDISSAVTYRAIQWPLITGGQSGGRNVSTFVAQGIE